MVEARDFVTECVDRAMGDLSIVVDAEDEAFIRAELRRLIEEEPQIRSLYRGAEPHLAVYETGEACTLGEPEHAGIDAEKRRAPAGGES